MVIPDNKGIALKRLPHINKYAVFNLNYFFAAHFSLRLGNHPSRIPARVVVISVASDTITRPGERFPPS